ncbi:MAG: o-succinylbenzoate synthase [Acidobacteria bacterium]|nr:o-succinylbenzoate synthase [Acidobacteriota bacterium]
MKLDRIELREIQMPLLAPFATSFGQTTQRRILLVRVWDQDGADGRGECVASETPFYSHETIDTAWVILVQFIGPMVLHQGLTHPADLSGRLARIRGHRMAKGALEAACWELQARKESRPLWQLLGGTRREIECGVSIGIQPSLPQLFEKINTALAAGYRRIKLKIKPGLDIELVGEVRHHFPDIRLMVDANSAYRLTDAERLERLDEFDLMMIEQPLAHDDLIDHAALQRRLRTPICLDESIRTRDQARQALEIGACHVINIKLGRVGGHAEAKKIHDLCLQRRVPVWCGGMLESGIGRAHNIALSTLDGFILPGDVSASKRYWKQDIIQPEVEVTPRGTIEVPSGAGLGYQIDEERISALTVRTETLK